MPCYPLISSLFVFTTCVSLVHIPVCMSPFLASAFPAKWLVGQVKYVMVHACLLTIFNSIFKGGLFSLKYYVFTWVYLKILHNYVSKHGY